MPAHKMRLSLSSRFFSSSGSTPTTPSSEDYPPTPRSNSFRHKSRSSLSKFFGLSSAPTSPTIDFSKSHLDKLAKVQQCEPVPACPVRRHTEPPQLVHDTEKPRPFDYPSAAAIPLPQPRPSPSHRRSVTARHHKHESRCLQALSPRLFVAFEDDTIPFNSSYSDDLCAPSGSSFDHIVRITSHPRHVPGLPELEVYLAPRAHCHYLRDMDKLCRDPEAIIRSKEERVSSLNIDQLVSARDFIFRAEGTVLITTPRDARMEAMTLALAYLAYSTGYGAKEIMRSQNDRTVGFKSVWQHTLSEQGLEVARQVAAQRPIYREDVTEAADALRF